MIARPDHHHTGLFRFRPSRAELRALLRLAVPVVTVQVGLMFMGVVDTIMAGHLSARALAAVALGNLYFYGVAVFGMGVLMAIEPIVSQAVGARDETAIARAVQRGMLVALVLAVVGSLLFLPAESVLRLLKQPAEIVPAAAEYTRIMIPGTFPFFAFIVVRQSLQSMTVLRPILLGIAVANLANVFLNWVLIFGHFGFPALGVAGAAWATSISRGLLLGVLLVAAWPRLRAFLLPLRRDVLDGVALLRMLRLGVPIGLHHMLEYGAFASVLVIMGILGTLQVASHQVAINLASLTFMVPLGVAQAGGVLVGQAVGRGDDDAARRAAGSATICGVAFMGSAALAFLLLPAQLAGLYTSDAAVLALGAALIQIAGVFQVFDGLQVVGTGLLRGVGDTRVPMLAGLVGFWLIGMPFSLWLGFGYDLGAAGLWWGLVVGLGVVGLFLMARVYRKLGGTLERVVIEKETVLA